MKQIVLDIRPNTDGVTREKITRLLALFGIYAESITDTNRGFITRLIAPPHTKLTLISSVMAQLNCECYAVAERGV
ncbi:hypothetical protein HUU62_08825 [Rhodoferax sp. 4810]|uniref:Uncharacterized protein n=1 Tax=Thiospirillum jenense TaxID=1653858 RepID=A0A839H747_9GAMM|nr:hypothetical protein [Thiospirillum jenense]MBB1074513.1 hypothetical protein [Rhodoferax jenense]MBB1125503.1 hypothetical protein [Thiospirillum jenense]